MSTDNLSPEQRKRTMANVRSQDTKPEMWVRQFVHGQGYRYRLHRRDLPGNPDIVFSSRRKVIFVHGCFWHGHDCPSGAKRPKSNPDYWNRKLQRNKVRDVVNQEILREDGWDIMVIWECQLKEPELLQSHIIEFLEESTKNR